MLHVLTPCLLCYYLIFKDICIALQSGTWLQFEGVERADQENSKCSAKVLGLSRGHIEIIIIFVYLSDLHIPLISFSIELKFGLNS